MKTIAALRSRDLVETSGDHPNHWERSSWGAVGPVFQGLDPYPDRRGGGHSRFCQFFLSRSGAVGRVFRMRRAADMPANWLCFRSVFTPHSEQSATAWKDPRRAAAAGEHGCLPEPAFFLKRRTNDD